MGSAAVRWRSIPFSLRQAAAQICDNKHLTLQSRPRQLHDREARFGRTAELSAEKIKYLDYGYTVDALKNVRAERVIATGEGFTQQAFQGDSPKADLNLYTGTSSPAQEFSAAKEFTSPEIARPAKQQHDFGIEF